jgi:hypothetical protein
VAEGAGWIGGGGMLLGRPLLVLGDDGGEVTWLAQVCVCPHFERRGQARRTSWVLS